MESAWWRRFTERKIRATACLIENCQGTYGDVVLILSAVLSAMAAECWPGKGIDKRRFIQLLTDYDPCTMLISIPRLRSYLISVDAHDQDALVRDNFMKDIHEGQIIRGPDVDQKEATITTLVKIEIPLAKLREYSYASLIYKEVRSSYAHEYKIGNQADLIRMTSSESPDVSYVNMEGRTNRLIHFPLDMIANVTRNCASCMDRLDGNLPREWPATWWIDG